ncbi:MAG: BtpA/SgcQ family protein [Planctomycetota bacterium]
MASSIDLPAADVFPSATRRLAGVVHLAPTPGTTRAGDAHEAMAALLERAVRDAEAWVAGGVDTLVVENYHDAPFRKAGLPAATVAALALATDRVRSVPGVASVGVNALRNDAAAALGVAAATGAAFVRVNVHTGAMHTDQGLVEGDAAETLLLRRALGVRARILADVHVKHATPVPGERIEDAARDALHRGRADGLIVSGAATGSAPDAERIARVRAAVGPDAPIVIGSGFAVETAGALLEHADGAIVGTAAKREGRVSEAVDPERVAALVEAARRAGG